MSSTLLLEVELSNYVLTNRNRLYSVNRPILARKYLTHFFIFDLGFLVCLWSKVSQRGAQSGGGLLKCAQSGGGAAELFSDAKFSVETNENEKNHLSDKLLITKTRIFLNISV